MDKYTRYARPTFPYVACVILLVNYAVMPLMGTSPAILPDALFWLIGAGVLGYGALRTVDKGGMKLPFTK